jgi:hypothetical protein
MIAELPDRGRLVVDLAKIFHRLTGLGDRHRYSPFVDIKPNKFFMKLVSYARGSAPQTRR